MPAAASLLTRSVARAYRCALRFAIALAVGLVATTVAARPDMRTRSIATATTAAAGDGHLQLRFNRELLAQLGLAAQRIDEPEARRGDELAGQP